MGVTVTGLHELEADLQTAIDEALPAVEKVTSKGALNIKRATQAAWQGLAHAPSLPSAVSYDITTSGLGVAAEIGPDKAKRQGALGNLLEYGSVNNAPIPALNPALDAEEPRYVAALANVVGDLLEGRRVRSDGGSE